ncbi:MAG: hypothetical protein H5T92_06015 [Synergistales bacterium]|nr:hypothetical protein [Synergistales bacterium]
MNQASKALSKLARGVIRSRDSSVSSPSIGGLRSLAIHLRSVSAIVVGLVFLARSVPYLKNPYLFLGSVYAYGLVGPRFGEVVAIILPYLQLVTAICLLGRILFGGALLTSCLLLSTFFAVQLSAFVRGLKISCGCFGPVHSYQVGASSLFWLTILLIVSIAGFASHLAAGSGSKS